MIEHVHLGLIATAQDEPDQFQLAKPGGIVEGTGGRRGVLERTAAGWLLDRDMGWAAVRQQPGSGLWVAVAESKMERQAQVCGGKPFVIHTRYIGDRAPAQAAGRSSNGGWAGPHKELDHPDAPAPGCEMNGRPERSGESQVHGAVKPPVLGPGSKCKSRETSPKYELRYLLVQADGAGRPGHPFLEILVRFARPQPATCCVEIAVPGKPPHDHVGAGAGVEESLCGGNAAKLSTPVEESRVPVGYVVVEEWHDELVEATAGCSHRRQGPLISAAPVEAAKDEAKDLGGEGPEGGHGGGAHTVTSERLGGRTGGRASIRERRSASKRARTRASVNPGMGGVVMVEVSGERQKKNKRERQQRQDQSHQPSTDSHRHTEPLLSLFSSPCRGGALLPGPWLECWVGG